MKSCSVVGFRLYKEPPSIVQTAAHADFLLKHQHDHPETSTEENRVKTLNVTL